MDVKRLATTLLRRSTDQSSLSGDTLQDYRVVKHNMASVAKFDVRLAVEQLMAGRERRTRLDKNIQRFIQYRNMYHLLSATHEKQDDQTFPTVNLQRHSLCVANILYTDVYFDDEYY